MKKIKILTITLVIVAVTMIAFFGVYIPVQNRMENQVREYDLAMDLKGSRNIRLKVNTETETTIKDAEGNKVEDSANLTDEEIAEKGYTKEEKAKNGEEVKNIENYKTSQKVIEKRLQKLGVSNYIIKLEEETGDIVIELPENENTDHVVSNLSTVGKFEIIDSETKEVLLNNQDIKQAKVMYGSGNNSTSANNGTTVYLDIEFNKEGSKKLEEISNQYRKTENETTQNTTSEGNATTEENTTSEENSAATNTEATSEKKITMNIDDNEIMSTSFEEPVRTGKLQLSIGSASTDKNTLQGYIDQASSMATVLDTGNIPVKYDVNSNQYILSDITENEMELAIYIVLAVVVIALIVWIVRYKALGALGVISYIGFVSLYMIIVRYTNVVLALEGFFGMGVAFVLNYILVNKLLAQKQDRKEVYKNFFIKIIPIIILVITFCFIRWTPISSFGMTMFWGIVLIVLYNIAVTNSLLKIETGKEK